MATSTASSTAAAAPGTNMALIKGLTFLMFTMFAMTTDSVGVIIPEVIKEFKLTMTAGGAFHYAPMTAIAIAGVMLGFLADKLGRKKTIILGLVLFALNSFLFATGNSFVFFLCLLSVSGAAIGIFKTGALALIGDISTSTAEHTSTMNMIEGFFGIGAMIGPAVVTRLLAGGVSWKYLYVIAGCICMLLIAIAAVVKYPETKATSEEPASLGGTFSMMSNPFALGASAGAFLYVAVECAIYVWMPTLLKDYNGSAAWLAGYAITIFFALRVAGRFLGAWLLARLDWSLVLMVLSLAILFCFGASMWGGPGTALYLLPLSGLFMSVLYPTINSKGISCFAKAQHGAVSGVILFFTCLAAALGPLAMGAVSDAFGGAKYGFFLATGFATLLFAGAFLNWMFHPAASRLAGLDDQEYGASGAH